MTNSTAHNQRRPMIIIDRFHIQQPTDQQFFLLIHALTMINTNVKRCDLCQKQAFYICSRCQNSSYCSKQHQIEHWKKSHKFKCFPAHQKTSQNIQTSLKQRFFFRKQYFQSFSHRNFNVSIIDAKKMLSFQKSIKENSPSGQYDIMNQFEYGASVCLLSRSYLLISDKNNARTVLQKYLTQKQQFLTNTSNILLNKEEKEGEKQVFLKKMNLLSTIANLCHALDFQCIKYYVLYTHHIEKAFGELSNQASNCYFQLGCYFAEEGFFNRAIACFTQSAEIREKNAGSCYFNIGVLYTFQEKYIKALEMFDLAYKLQIQEHGEDSQQVAEVAQNKGMIYVEMNNYVTAMQQYERAFEIRSIYQNSAEYNNLLDRIHELYQKLCTFLSIQHDEFKQISVFQELKEGIDSNKAFWRHRAEKRIITEQEDVIDDMEEKQKQKSENLTKQITDDDNDKKRNGNLILFLDDELLNALAPTELFALSQLQIQLNQLESEFQMAYIIGKSTFLKKLNRESLRKLEKINSKLFSLIRMDQLAEIKK